MTDHSYSLLALIIIIFISLYQKPIKMFRIALVVLLFVSLANSFLLSTLQRKGRMMYTNKQNNILKMSDEEMSDPLKDLRDRMASDPNFDPTSDPKFMEALESTLPEALREMPIAIERLNVSFKNAISGTDAVENLDEAVKVFKDEKFISSPQSKWFQAGSPDESYSESTKKSLLNSLLQKHPEVKQAE